jgi:hypothetical protein
MPTEAGPSLAERFATVFREEHRTVRDLLLGLIDAAGERDVAGFRERLAAIAAATGPHFRYEEEALYPALVPFFGGEYVDQLLADHDRAITAARRLAELAAQEALAEDDAAEAVRLARGVLPHVSDCEGLSIMVELFADADVEPLLRARESALGEPLDLLTWASEVRKRRAPAA